MECFQTMKTSPSSQSSNKHVTTTPITSNAQKKKLQHERKLAASQSKKPNALKLNASAVLQRKLLRKLNEKEKQKKSADKLASRLKKKN
jgi:hypothetical protein